MARRRAPVRHRATLHLLVLRQARRGCAARLQLEQAGRADKIANGIEASQDGRIFVELITAQFLKASGTPNQFRAGIERAIALGWLWRHEERDLCEIHRQRCGAVCVES
jgi:hypothetical protein